MLDCLEIDRKTWQATHFKSIENNKNTIGHRYIRSLFTDAKGDIWIGHYGGFSKYNYKTNDFTRFLNQSKKLPESTRVYDFKQAPDGTVWIAGWDVLLSYNIELDTFHAFLPNAKFSKGLSNGNLREILLDNSGQIRLIASEKGVVYFDNEENKFINFKFDPNTSFSLPSNNVFHCF